MEVLEVMRDWNSRCSPSWTESELLKKIHSARDNGTPRAVKEISGPEDVEYWTDDADADRPIELDIISLDDVQERPIDWLWKDRFELGGIGLIFGDPSAGKSTASYDLAARVSTGTPWPDGSECKQGYVLLATCEDQIATTVKPKIRKSKGNPKNIGIINCVHKVINGKREEYTFTLSDVKLLERSIIKTNARLVIIDPVGAYMNKVDTHKDADIRQLLGPLAKMAEKTNCAIILVMHMNKNTKGVKAMYRVIGSIGFIGAARSAFAVVTDATDIVSVRPTPSSIRGADLA
jgi:RecA-family ATPase